jgi:raffinose/stachyose/melibiose transport system permease protein
MHQKRATIKPYLYILPAMAAYGVFVLYPALGSLMYSFTDWDGVSQPRFIGLSNYVKALTRDPLVWTALQNNVIYMIFFSLIPIAVGLLLASLIGRSRLRGINFFRTALFMPQVVPLVAVGVIWGWIYNPAFGVLNQLLTLAGVPQWGRAWLGDFDVAMLAIGGIGSWVWYGFCMVIFLAGMQKIEEALYEAAKIDGAHAVQQFWHITLPELRREITVCLVMTLTAALKVFAIVYVTTIGGPGSTTLPISLYVFKNGFEYNRLGYATSIAVLLTLLIFIIIIATIRLRENSESEES